MKLVRFIISKEFGVKIIVTDSLNSIITQTLNKIEGKNQQIVGILKTITRIR